MATENPVTQVLSPTGNQAPMAAGSRETALAIGQFGIFNYHTGLSVDGSVLADCQDIYFAVGLNRGSGVLDDVQRSAGQMIQVKHVKSNTVKGYVSPLPKIVEVTGFDAQCETDYAIKIEIRSQQAYGISGYSQISETFSYRTGCCTQADCVSCPQGDCNELALGLMTNINAQPEKWATASLFVNIFNTTIATAPTADGNLTVTVGTEVFIVPILDADVQTGVATKIAAFINGVTASKYAASSSAAILSVYPKKSSTANATTVVVTPALGVTVSTTTTGNVNVTDLVAFEVAHPGVCVSLRITSNAAAAVPFNGHIPIKYYSSTYQDIIVSLTGSFNCNGTATIAQNLQIEDGNGGPLAEMEYEAGGWNGKPGPYRTSAVTGLEKGNYDQFINPAANYNQIALTYDLQSVGGWLEYLNNLQTIIAIPCADNTTLTGIYTILDLIFSTRFGAMTNDVAAMDCTNTEVHTINNYALDGIESLA